MSYHLRSLAKKADTFVTIAEEELEAHLRPGRPTDSDKPRRGVRHFFYDLNSWASSFFPWSNGDLPRITTIKEKSTIPWLGLGSLFTSALTVFLSWLILRLIDHRQEIVSKYFKPASWLSALLSLNTIALHVALSEGVTTAWWYKASRQDATVQDLHDTWTMGTSLAAVLLSGRKFNYIAMATVFVATIPLNGLLLQSAISNVPGTYQNSTTLLVPMVSTVPMGFSAAFDNRTNLIGTTGPALGEASQATSGYMNWGYGNSYPWFDDPATSGCANGDNSAACSARALGPGFKVKCNASQPAYNLTPKPNHNISARVFSTSFSWDPTEPNTIRLDAQWKPDPFCESTYEVKACTLQAAVVSYPVTVTQQPATGATPVFALATDSTYQDDNVVEVLPVYPGEGETNTTYGGIAAILSGRFDSHIQWNYINGVWSTQTSGQFAQSFAPVIGFLQEPPWNPSPTDPGFCQLIYNGLNSRESTEPGDFDVVTSALGQLRQLMFQSSVLQFVGDFTNPIAGALYVKQSQRVPAIQTQTVLRYKVSYAYWAASMAVTVSIILVILPTFYGFWTLTRRTTLSPFETAAAFHAPVLQGADMRKDTRVLLREVGTRNVHDPIQMPPTAVPTWTRPEYHETP